MTDVADLKPAGPAPPRPAAALIPFPVGGRRHADGEPARGPGRILLFTGVRYERLPEPAAAPLADAAPAGASRRVRRPRRAASERLRP